MYVCVYAKTRLNVDSFGFSSASSATQVVSAANFLARITVVSFLSAVLPLNNENNPVTWSETIQHIFRATK